MIAAIAEAQGKSPMAEAFIALGGNVGDVRTTFERAIAMLCDGATCGSWRARPITARRPGASPTSRPSSMPSLPLTTSLSPHDSCARAEECERALGRDRAHERRWGPRVIDIDLLAYDDVELHDRRADAAASASVRARVRSRAARRDRAGSPDRRHPGARGARCARAGSTERGIEKLPPAGAIRTPASSHASLARSARERA